MNPTWLAVAVFAGLFLTALGGLGIHNLDRFNGRELENYCLARRNRERFGEILDLRDTAVSAAHYIHLLGVLLALPAASWWIAQRLGWLQVTPAADSTLTAPQGIWLFAIASFTLLVLSLWLPKAVVRVASPIFVYHSWPFWKFVAKLIAPLATFGELFELLGYRLRDEQPDEDFDEEMLEDEIRTRIAAGQREGLVGLGVSEMIAGVMNLDEENVTRIMTPRSVVDAVDIDTPWPELLRLVADLGRTRLPVYRESLDNIQGILFAKDLLPIFAADESKDKPALESLLRKPWFVPDSKQVDELLRDFLHNRNHMAIVLDEFHQVVGVVTIEDALEQIVGEIADELDEEEASEFRMLEDGLSVEAEGKVSVSLLNKRLGWELPESDDYDTLAGLVISKLGLIPVEGAKVHVEGIDIVVTGANKRQIVKLRAHHTRNVAPVKKESEPEAAVSAES